MPGIRYQPNSQKITIGRTLFQVNFRKSLGPVTVSGAQRIITRPALGQRSHFQKAERAFWKVREIALLTFFFSSIPPPELESSGISQRLFDLSSATCLCGRGLSSDLWSNRDVGKGRKKRRNRKKEGEEMRP